VADIILLAYSRRIELDENDEHLHDGYISNTRGTATIKEPFEGLPYHQMVTRLSKTARSLPNLDIHLMRLEQKPQPVAMQMDPHMADLLRSDPVQYIRATSLPAQKVRVGTPARVGDTVVIKPMPLRAGYDTLAAVFGDTLYVRIKPEVLAGQGPLCARKAECPLCGRWRAEAVKQMDIWIVCQDCGVTVHCGFKFLGDWVGIPTDWLLSHHSELKPRYYLPREWNTSGPWITHEDLKARYETYLKEKEACMNNSTSAGTPE